MPCPVQTIPRANLSKASSGAVRCRFDGGRRDGCGKGRWGVQRSVENGSIYSRISVQSSRTYRNCNIIFLFPVELSGDRCQPSFRNEAANRQTAARSRVERATGHARFGVHPRCGCNANSGARACVQMNTYIHIIQIYTKGITKKKTFHAIKLKRKSL